MPLFAAGTLTALRASGMNWSFPFLGLCVMVSVLSFIFPALIDNLMCETGTVQPENFTAFRYPEA